MSWTKGKWVTKIQTDKRHKVVVVMTEDGESLIASAYSGHVGWPAAEANAALIAAAPELYEALEELSALMEAVRKGEYKPDSFTCQPAELALAKVRGDVKPEGN